jgi:hypothetical protein
MSAYGAIIIEATECKPDETYQIEDAIRASQSTLDSLTKSEIVRLARRANAVRLMSAAIVNAEGGGA